MRFLNRRDFSFRPIVRSQSQTSIQTHDTDHPQRISDSALLRLKRLDNKTGTPPLSSQTPKNFLTSRNPASSPGDPRRAQRNAIVSRLARALAVEFVRHVSDLQRGHAISMHSACQRITAT